MTSSVSRKRIGVAIILLCILFVSAVGYIYFSWPKAVSLAPSVVGVIHIDGPIVSTSDTDLITSTINHAAINASVKAIVIKIDSPGGSADLVEQVYFDLLELKKIKPMVASVTTALSGGFYIAVAADYIYALPISMVGNVGVLGTNPPILIPSDSTLETGSRKVTGFSILQFPFNLSHALESFALAVETGRKDKIKISSNELKRGTVYFGSEALTVGLVDEIGSLQKAAEHAAVLAGLPEYIVEDLKPDGGSSSGLVTTANQTNVEWGGINIETLRKINPPPAIYYLYLPSQAYANSEETKVTPASEALTTEFNSSRGMVIADLSHGNMISPWELDAIAAELAERGLLLTFASAWSSVEQGLGNASGLIIAAPTTPYNLNESAQIETFVNEGRILLLLSDPATEYLSIPNLLGPVNSLANRFGLSFAKGYLYNEDEHYGIYRNIYIREFASTSLTANLNTVVLFTANYIHSKGNGVAWTSNETYSSTAERQDRYSPISAVVEGKGIVLAIGDITFLTEPYCYVEDNYKLILNIVQAIVNVETQS